MLPEELGERAAMLLLDEVKRGGCVDSCSQATTLLLMCLTPEDVSRVRVGNLTKYAIEALRMYKDVFGVEMKIRAEEETKTVLLSCLGTGFTNQAKKVT